ncbi:MAG: hypothetical protein F6K28_58710 [Microcoleus sp. SIO2G3]|nr:hypothetical protein [Microcoleus sp. SIO2G3]
MDQRWRLQVKKDFPVKNGEVWKNIIAPRSLKLVQRHNLIPPFESGASSGIFSRLVAGLSFKLKQQRRDFGICTEPKNAHCR